jgi:hypothetical protein
VGLGEGGFTTETRGTRRFLRELEDGGVDRAAGRGTMGCTARRAARGSGPAAFARRRRWRDDGLEVLIRRALRAVVEDVEPSPRVWEGLRRRVLS